MPGVRRGTIAGVRLIRQCSHYLTLLALFAGAVSGTATGKGVDDAERAPCRFTPAASADGSSPGLILGAEVLLPEGSRPGYGVHIRFNGGLGAVGEFDSVRSAIPDAAVLDCRGAAVLRRGSSTHMSTRLTATRFPTSQLRLSTATASGPTACCSCRFRNGFARQPAQRNSPGHGASPPSRRHGDCRSRRTAGHHPQHRPAPRAR